MSGDTPTKAELYARAFDDVDANLSHVECEEWAEETHAIMLGEAVRTVSRSSWWRWLDPDAPGGRLASDALLAIDGLRQEVERLRRELKNAEADADACFRDSVAAWDRGEAQP